MRRRLASAKKTAAGFHAVSAAPETYVLRLYIAGTTPRSTRAVMNIKEICESALSSLYDLEVIDIYQQPGMAKAQQIIAAPTLIKEMPLPLKKFIGDMSDRQKILIGLNIKPKERT